MEKEKGKAAKCIEMLRYLNDGRVHSIKELAEELGTKERNILEYKRELDKFQQTNVILLTLKRNTAKVVVIT